MPDVAKDYVDHVRLGQTERGSFILTILSPHAYDPPEEHPSMFDAPFGRRVSERLGVALQAVDVAITASVSEGVKAFEQATAAGVSAKF